MIKKSNQQNQKFVHTTLCSFPANRRGTKGEGRFWTFSHIFFLLIALWVIGCGPKIETVQQNGETYQVYWDNNQQKQVHHGTYKAFYESGAQKISGQYEHGNKTGLWMQYYENGQKQSQMDWVDGKPEGTVTEWYENGQKKNEGLWKNGGRHGLSTWWYSDGTKAKEVTYIDGEPDGTWIYWDSVGTITKQQFWDRGKFLSVIPPDSTVVSPVK